MQGLINPLTNQPIEDAELKTLSDLIKLQADLERQVSSLEDTLARAASDLKRVSETLIPDTMAQLGLSSMKLDDGTKVEVSTYYAASIPADAQSAAFAWLRETGNDSIIKRTVSCQFGKGEDKEANELAERLDALGYSFNDKANVHPQTLKAFVREQIESNKPFPQELFGVFIGKRTKLTPPQG